MGFEESRPTGVTLIAVLFAIDGLAFIGLSFFIGGFAAFFGLMALSGALFFAFIGVGAVCFAAMVGLLRGRPWAWKLAVISAVIGAIIGLFDIIGLILNLVILYYLYRPHVKDYFGQGGSL